MLLDQVVSTINSVTLLMLVYASFSGSVVVVVIVSATLEDVDVYRPLFAIVRAIRYLLSRELLSNDCVPIATFG